MMFARVTVVCTFLNVKLCRVFKNYIQKGREIQKSCLPGHCVAVIHVATAFSYLQLKELITRTTLLFSLKVIFNFTLYRESFSLENRLSRELKIRSGFQASGVQADPH